MYSEILARCQAFVSGPKRWSDMKLERLTINYSSVAQTVIVTKYSTFNKLLIKVCISHMG